MDYGSHLSICQGAGSGYHLNAEITVIKEVFKLSIQTPSVITLGQIVTGLYTRFARVVGEPKRIVWFAQRVRYANPLRNLVGIV